MRATVIRTATALTAAVSVLTLAACSPGGSGDLDWSDSPLQAHFEDLYGALGSWDEEEMSERDRRMQELVAACMNAEGFEYYPVVHDMGITYPAPGEDDETENLWEPEKREWVEKYGYGIVNDPWRSSEGWGSEEPIPLPGPGEEYHDPNMDYYETLSESEQQAYDKALYGESLFIFEEGFYEEGVVGEEEVIIGDGPGDESPTAEDYGCYGKANDEVFADLDDFSSVWEDPQFAGVMEALNALYTDMEGHPDSAALERNWATCMAESGHSGYLTRGDAENAIHQELEPYYLEETEDIWSLPEVQELGQREIEIALVDFDCRDKLDYENESLRIQFALEEQFLADYKVELDALKQAFEQAAN